MTIHAYAAAEAGAPLAPFEYEPEPLAAHEVEIAITHCGICHSDLSLIDNAWGNTTFPLVPGHEIVGEISAVGSAVSEQRVGHRVGIGWQRGSCGHCDDCIEGEEPFCAENEATCVGHFGGFADRIRISSRFCFSLPEAIGSASAAPLLCGGATVFTPLSAYGVRPDHRVGVVGVGGLGHLALQFARAWGCEVTAFSHTADKRDEALELGAHRFVATGEPGAVEAAAGSLDFLLSTACADLDWAAYLNLLRPRGILCIVGVPPSDLILPAFPLIVGRRSVGGSVIAGRRRMRDMLRFAARHGVGARVEEHTLSGVNGALTRVRSGRARYRVVLTP